MRLQKILFRLLGAELLTQGLLKLLFKRAYNFKEEFRKQLRAWALKVAILLLIIGLLQIALLFGLGALALYLNVLLGSSYQGFLWVSGGCVAFLLLLLLVRWLGQD
ncbi:MAG: hypothetical protein AAF963_01100 [Bacteroidota bacterium]